MMNANENIPISVGLIMDGNRRWASEQGLSSFEGHRAGYKKLKEFMSWAREAGIKNVFAYVFSTENWKRSPEEVSKLFELMEWALKHETEEFKGKGIAVSFVGQRERFSASVQESMERVEEETKNGAIKLWAGLSYGGRAEIVDAATRIPEGERKHLTEDQFAECLWTRSMPDPELIIRTGGERRLSNFLLWQAAYAELYFSDTYWPAFSREEFKDILADFSRRDRRKGA